MHRQMAWCLTQIKLLEVLELNDLPDLRKFEGCIVACSLLKIAFIVCTQTEAFIAKLRKRQSPRAVDVVVAVGRRWWRWMSLHMADMAIPVPYWSLLSLLYDPKAHHSQYFSIIDAMDFEPEDCIPGFGVQDSTAETTATEAFASDSCFFWKHLEQIRRTMLKICCFHVVSNIYKAALWWVYSRGEFWDVVKHNSFSMMEGMITPMCLADIFHMFFRVHLSARRDFRNQLPCLMRCRCSDFRCFWITWRHCCHYHRRENGSETRSSQKSISDSFCLWECFLHKMLIHVWSHQHYILSTYIYVCQ